jgi:hypothetical protein
MFPRPLGARLHLKSGYVLPLLTQDGDDIHGCTASQPNQDKLHRLETVVIATHPRRSAHIKAEAATSRSGKGHPLLQSDFRVHLAYS